MAYVSRGRRQKAAGVMETEIGPLEVEEPRQNELVPDSRGELRLVLDSLQKEIWWAKLFKK